MTAVIVSVHAYDVITCNKLIKLSSTERFSCNGCHYESCFGLAVLNSTPALGCLTVVL